MCLKKLIYLSVFMLAVFCITSCKHEAGVLDKCLGKNLTIDTSSSTGMASSSGNVGEINFDTMYIGADIKKPPFLGSVDSGVHWFSLPVDTTLNSGSYKVVIKDADNCLSPIYSFKTN